MRIVLVPIELNLKHCQPASYCGECRGPRGQPRSGVCVPFIDPALPAPDAPFWWTERAGAKALEARSWRWRRGQVADLSLARTSVIRHIVVDSAGIEHVLIRTGEDALTLKLSGARAHRGPVRLNFHVKGRKLAPAHGTALVHYNALISVAAPYTNRTLRRVVLRNALIALDGDTAKAKHFEIAAAIFGRLNAKQAWKGGSRSMKELVRRARKMGRQLRDGGYRELIR